jgi:hypothetical protein
LEGPRGARDAAEVSAWVRWVLTCLWGVGWAARVECQQGGTLHQTKGGFGTFRRASERDRPCPCQQAVKASASRRGGEVGVPHLQ